MSKADRDRSRAALPPATLVLGGARSGKSRWAERLVEEAAASGTYCATAEALDAEMAARIAAHRARRSTEWKNIEAPQALAGVFSQIPAGAPVLVDCLTLWLSNRCLAGADIDAEVGQLADALARHVGPVVLVTNEVGSGIVPDNALARRFRDEQGRLNQRIAALAGRVVLVVAGLPLILKGSA